MYIPEGVPGILVQPAWGSFPWNRATCKRTQDWMLYANQVVGGHSHHLLAHHTTRRGRDEASGPSTRWGEGFRAVASGSLQLSLPTPTESHPHQRAAAQAGSYGHLKRGGPTAAKASQQPTIAAGNHGHPTRVVPRLLARLSPLLLLPPAQAFKARWRLPRRGLSREGIQQRTGKESSSAIPSSLSTSAQGPEPVNPSRSESVPLQEPSLRSTSLPSTSTLESRRRRQLSHAAVNTG